MPKLSPVKLAERRDHILTAALHCFEKHGFSATSVDVICAEGKISKGAFYTHFESKDKLIESLLQRRGQAIALRAKSRESFGAEIVENFFADGLTSSRGRLELEAIAASASSPALRALMSENLQLISDQLADGLQNLELSGVLKLRENPEDIAEIIRCFVLGKVVVNVVHPDCSADEIVHSIDVLIRSLSESL